MHYVIIGNGISAVSAVKAIREIDKKGETIIISDEPYVNYSRPLISYLLGKKVGEEKINFCSEDFYRENKVTLLLNKRAKKIDLKKKNVILSDKQKVHFDKLLIVTGAKPFIPEIKGINLSGVFTFTKLADAKKIAKYIKAEKSKHAVVIGGGLIGLKATEALLELKIKVTIVELADRILSTTFDRKASSIIKHALEKIGCKLIVNNTAVEVKSEKRKAKNEKRKNNSKVKSIILKNGQKIQCDLLIVAVGVRPNTELAEETPIEINKGILVNNFMQTSVQDIYAAGDCCGGVAIWPAAASQGRIAGYNMAGKRIIYQGSLAMNSVELCGIPTISVGQTNLSGGDCEIIERFNPDKSIYKKVVLQDNKILGVIFVGNIERAGIYTGLIKDKVSVLSFKEYLLREDFGLICLPKEYRKHLVTDEVAII